MNISKNFTLEEFTRSETALKLSIDNQIPNAAIVSNIRNLVENILQPLRDEFGVINVSSGYRCHLLNEAVDGCPTSAHLIGCAADISSPFHSFENLQKFIRKNCVYDQSIIEQSVGLERWLHVSLFPSNRNETFTLID